MGTVVRRNERSWAIVMIAEIRTMLLGMHLKIKSAGGESTLSVNHKSMFPDVLLYEDEAQNKILQGWELKMPDVLITDEALLADAERKARALGLNSFVVWNFTYGKLYIRKDEGGFAEAKVWNGTCHIKSREDVAVYKTQWLAVVRDIVLTVNDYLVNGAIAAAFVSETISDGLMTELIQRNKELTAEYMKDAAAGSTPMECRLKVWWNAYRAEYDEDEDNVYSAYAKSVLLNWTNRIMFANAIKKYHNCAYRIDAIDRTTAPSDGNAVIDSIAAEGDFYHVFQKAEFNDILPEDTWLDIVDYNQFLVANKIEKIDQSVLQEILEKTVNTAKREIRGQYATPAELADLLCRMTVHDWHTDCADLCAGTGTIAKALITNKSERLRSAGESFGTTWIADKYAYPLQIAGIAVTDIKALNIPLNIFQSDVFALSVHDQIEIKSPVDGSGIKRELPAFGAVVSNLPFVEYNKIAADEAEYLAAYRQKIADSTGILFTQGKTDLYTYLPFKLHELLDKNGRLGLILSNSWLGTDIGRKFFTALQYYYEIQAAVLSDRGRWFQNADVVACILILQKKETGLPDKNQKTDFWLLHKDIRKLQAQEKETIVNSVVLGEELDEKTVSVKSYSNAAIKKITKKGITLNALFHDVSWVEEMRDCLIPVSDLLTVKRGERRGWNDLFYPPHGHGIEKEYLKPVLKNPARLKSYTAQADITAFCCHRSKEELRRLGHTGALNWIEKFENMTNGTGRILPEALKRKGCYWYEMDDGARADFVTALNPDRRLFVARFEEPTFTDQRFTRLLIKDPASMRAGYDKQTDLPGLIHALLNSLYGMFAVEAIGFGRGLGVLDASSTRLKKMYMINPEVISDADAAEIVRLFEKIKSRNVMDTEEELGDAAREAFDRKVLQAAGHEDLYLPVRKSLLSMQHTRHTACF